MSSRFGRNQRRAFRAKVAALEANNLTLEHRARRAEVRSVDAYARGASDLLNTKYLSEAVRSLVDRLERNLEPDLAREAKRVLEASMSQRRMPSFMEFSAHADLMEPTVMVLSVRIPEVRANIAMHPGF